MPAITFDALCCPSVRLVVFLSAVLASGCASIGPGSVPRDRVNYANAIADSWREQMLLNIVKLRYFDAPAFMEVSSVIGSYTLQGGINAQGRVYGRTTTSTSREPLASLGISGSYADHPTITYTPITGRKYIDSLLRPIPPEAIFAMIQGGHAADFILGLSVEAINGIYNSSSRLLQGRPEDQRFRQVIEALRRIQDAAALEIRTETRDRKEVTLLAFRSDAGPETDKDIRLVRETLGIAPQVKELRVGFGAAPGKVDQITLLTRSMLKILANISSGVDVPKEDVAEGRAIGAPAAGGESRPFAIAHVHSGSERPLDAYAAVRYRDRWFWIDDRDLGSKRVFTFLLVFSSIAESGAVPQVPVITIPAG
jgi:hypothetical protein